MMMRTNQISVRINRVPPKNITKSKDDETPPRKSRRESELLSVYADANNVHEALCSAFNETILEIRRRCDFGRLKEDVEEHYSKEYETRITIHYSEVLNPRPRSNINFSAISTDIYEGLSVAFNKVLFES